MTAGTAPAEAEDVLVEEVEEAVGTPAVEDTAPCQLQREKAVRTKFTSARESTEGASS